MEFEGAHEQFETLTPEYAVADYTPPVNLVCLTVKGGFRVYATADNGHLEIFPGISAPLEETTDQSWKAEWYGQVGIETARRILAESQAYGTLLHGQIAHFLKECAYNFQKVEEVVSVFLLSHPVETANVTAWVQQLKEDMLGFIQWRDDVNFRPLCIELPLVSRTYRIASRVDLFGKMTIGDQGLYVSGKQKGRPKGELKEVFVIVDIKSSRKSYTTDANALQLVFYEHLIKENFPHVQNNDFLLYNWKPKGWESDLGYQFVNQTGKKTLDELDLCLRLYHLRTSFTKARTVISGEYRMDANIDPATLFTRETYLSVLARELNTTLPAGLDA